MGIGLELISTSAIATLVVGIIAGLLRGFSGFGGAIFAVPMLSLVYGPAAAIAVVLASGAIGTVQLMPGALPFARWRAVLPVLAGSLVFTPLGTYLLLTGDPNVIRRGIGIFVLLAALLMFRGWSWRGPRTIPISGLAGVFSGLITGLGGMGGAIATLYLISSEHAVSVIRANLIVIIGVFNFVGFGYLLAGGAITADILVKVAIYTPTYMISIWIGARIFRGTADAVYRRVALWLLVAVGVLATIL